MKKKEQTPNQNKVPEVMNEFKEGELHIGNTDKIVTNPLEAIAIAYSEIEELEKKNKVKTSHTDNFSVRLIIALNSFVSIIYMAFRTRQEL
jgi:hypothetical protein